MEATSARFLKYFIELGSLFCFDPEKKFIVSEVYLLFLRVARKGGKSVKNLGYHRTVLLNLNKTKSFKLNTEMQKYYFLSTENFIAFLST